MNTRLPGRIRARWVAALTALLLLLGAGTAAAYWTATARVAANATSADTGLHQELWPAGEDAPSPLAGTYTPENPTLAGAVLITNTGTRDADYTVTVRADSASSSELAAAMQVTAVAVTSVEQCTPERRFAGAPTGTLPLTLEGDAEMDKAQTILVCVQSSLAADQVSRFADQQIELKISTVLEYAPVDQWRIGADQSVKVGQSVGGSPFAGVELMRCGGGTSYLELPFSSPNTEHREQIEYQAFFVHEERSDVRFPFDPRDLSGYYATVQMPDTSEQLRSFLNSPDGGMGNAWVYVEQRLAPDQEWAPAAVGQFHTTADRSPVALFCGWQ